METVMMKNKAGTQAGPVLLHHSRHQGSNVRGCERMEEGGEVKKRGQKLRRVKTPRRTTASLWHKQNYPWSKEMRERLTGEEDKAGFIATLCAALLMQQQRLCEMETERSP